MINYSIFCTVLLLIIMYSIIVITQTKISQIGSDHVYHLSLIKGIRRNNNKFLESHPNIIGEENFMYPQFYHWILSFLPNKYLTEKYHIISGFINALILLFFIYFSYLIYSYLEIDVPLYLFIFFSSLIFIFTPFFYLHWNAKNTGLSARGFGLLLGMIYQYLILFYFITENNFYFFIIFLIGFVIIISSQFTFQFFIFSIVFYSILYNNYFLLFVPIINSLLFFLLMPNIASNFFKGQYWHKKIYYKYLAKIYILDYRYSIWRDFIWDFWTKIKSKEIKKSLKYIYGNSLISIVLGFPPLFFIVFYVFINNSTSNIFLTNKNYYYLLYPLIISFLIFIITSLRKTRFLGEPERYIEFSMPFISVLGVIIFYNSISILIFLILISISLTILQLYLNYRVKKKSNNCYLLTSNKVRDVLKKTNENSSFKKIFSNNTEILRYLMDNENYRLLIPNISSFYTGKKGFTEIFPTKYSEVSEKVIYELIKEFDINYFILDNTILSEKKFSFEMKNVKFKRTKINDRFILFKIVEFI